MPTVWNPVTTAALNESLTAIAWTVENVSVKVYKNSITVDPWFPVTVPVLPVYLFFIYVIVTPKKAPNFKLLFTPEKSISMAEPVIVWVVSIV